jgi:formylglycine-generating enzyme required for sulfatase activity
MRRLVVLVAVLAGCELAVSTSGLEGGCPRRAGPPMVKVDTGSASYCIDSTEVTNAQYTPFVSAGSMPASPVPACAQATDPTPVDHWPPPPGFDKYPVVEVTWCQAYAYCASVGKRLCGEIGGGALAEPGTDAVHSQWLYVCSDGGAHAYPYGDTFDPNVCGGMAAGSQIAEVGSQPGCVGGLPGIYDLSGNVWEWTDTCHDDTTPNVLCHALGGAFDGTQADLACLGVRAWARNGGAANIGFRCCLDL